MTDYPRARGHVIAAARASRTTPDEILSRARAGNVSQGRALVYWLLRFDGLSFPQIGRLLERDHTTVMYGVEKVDSDPELLRLAWSLVPRKVAA